MTVSATIHHRGIHMFKQRLSDTSSFNTIIHWYLLSFNAGSINAGGFLATGKFVSHVTGFATLFGVDFIDDRPESAVGILSVPLFFLLGSFISGMLIDRPIHLKKRPHFDYVMGLSALCLFAAAGGGIIILSHLARFGQLFKLEQVYVLLALLCLACGLQNGAVTSGSGSTIRTTHLTGITTDLGLGLARIVTHRNNPSHLHRETRINLVRLGSILAFVFGSALGTWFFIQLGYRGFIIPGLISTYAAWHGRKEKHAAHKEQLSI